MKIEFIAHATFMVTLSDGRRLIIDPYQGMAFQGRFNYPPCVADVDFALITHEHVDHNYTSDLHPTPVIVRHGWQDDRLRITSVFVWHDKVQGTRFGGGVLAKIIEADGVRICHLGDCGEILSDAQISRFGKLDLLILPVGGFYTLDGDEAAALVSRMSARTIFPCHYKTSLCSLPIEPVDRFLSHFHHVTSLEYAIFDVSALPEGVVVSPGRFTHD